jgi:hypothetical protein
MPIDAIGKYGGVKNPVKAFYKAKNNAESGGKVAQCLYC